MSCLQVAVAVVHVIMVHATANEKICFVCDSLDLAKSNSENGLGMYSRLITIIVIQLRNVDVTSAEDARRTPRPWEASFIFRINTLIFIFVACRSIFMFSWLDLFCFVWVL